MSKACIKEIYTESEARAARSGMIKQGRPPMNVYYCEGCEGFHLSSRGSGKRLQKVKVKKFVFKPRPKIEARIKQTRKKKCK